MMRISDLYHENTQHNYIKQSVPESLFPEQRIEASKNTGPLLSIALAKRVKVGIANDSGTGHIMATAGCPLVSLFGPSNKQKFVNNIPNRIVFDAASFGSKDMSLIPVTAVISAVD